MSGAKDAEVEQQYRQLGTGESGIVGEDRVIRLLKLACVSYQATKAENQNRTNLEEEGDFLRGQVLHVST